MSSLEASNKSIVLKYFDGCNTGDLEDLLGTLDPEVVHYLLPERFKRGHRPQNKERLR